MKQLNNEKENFILAGDTMFIEKIKNRKNIEIMQEKPIKNHKNSKNVQNKMLETAYKTGLITYIKVLLDAYKSLPNIIGIIDKIIEKRASSLVTTNNIYGTSFINTYNQINKVIDLTERKDKLLNLFVIIEQILNSLEGQDRKIAIYKFVQKNTADEISKEINQTERTVFRRASRILEKLALYMLNQNWNVEFIKHQIGNEPWLSELYNLKKKEEDIIKNKTKSKS